MSLALQEQVLFDLLFDPAQRAAWLADPEGTLAARGLSPEECADFRHIRPDALVFDARVRLDLILSQLCRGFPVSFSLVSSLPGGLALLENLINGAWIRLHPDERATAFGFRLRERADDRTFPDPAEQAAFRAVLDAELAMVWTGAQLKAAVREGYRPPPAPARRAAGGGLAPPPAGVQQPGQAPLRLCRAEVGPVPLLRR